MRVVLIAGLITGLTTMATAQDGGTSWQLMAFHDLSAPSATDPLQRLVWPDAIRDQNAYVSTELKRPLNRRNALLTALAKTYHDAEGRTLIVSTALTRQCESGANDKGAEVEPSVCPVRIATVQDGRLLSLRTDTGCYADHADPDLPAKNRSDGTESWFDPASMTVSLRTRVGGRIVPSCDRTISVR